MIIHLDSTVVYGKLLLHEAKLPRATEYVICKTRPYGRLKTVPMIIRAAIPVLRTWRK
jgi:hypothetical protein